jgi:subtilisin family serine protease
MPRLRSAALWLALLAAGLASGAEPGPSAPRIVVAFANPAPQPLLPAGTSGSFYSGSGYHNGQSARQQARRIARSYGLRELDSWPIQALSMHCVVFEITDGRPAAGVLAAVSKESGVLLAQPLNEFHTLTTAADAAYNDPLYDLQTNLTTLGIARAHQRAQGAGVRIALIDTAVDVSHPDLAGRIVRSHSFLSAPAAAAGSLRHGTEMAGLIAAVANNHIGMVGIAPLARIEVFEACWQLNADADAAACNTFTLARALAAALASGAPLVNMSFAGPADPLLAALVQVGLRRGVVFVGAAAEPAAPFPTAIEGVLTASGTDAPPAQALAVPAQHVLTLRPHGQYDFASGSSVAAAEVTGVIALLMSAAAGRLDAPALRTLLKADTAALDVNAALALIDSRGHAALAARTH